MYSLSADEKKILEKISGRYYMSPIISNVENYVAKQPSPELGWRTILDNMNGLMRESQAEVEKILVKRKKDGLIKDIPQTRKAVVGQIFPNLMMHIFIQNKLVGNINPNIFITDQVKKAQFKQMTTIHVGDETQKPDMDILIYSEEDGELQNCMVVSLKTSLRERAGQTYKWKLLLEIAQSENSIREKYDIEYPSKIVPLVCFATVNFYDEINNPQHRGMFKFFDQSFIGKPIDDSVDFITPMSGLIDFVNVRL